MTTALLPLAASADPAPTALAVVAKTLGYHYAYLGPDEAVVLSRPGVVVLFRPGSPLYELNDRAVPIDGAVPSYKEGEIYVSRDTVAALRRLAATSAPLARPVAALPTAAEPPAPAAPGRVTIDALSATPIDGDQALHVEGQATPFSTLTLTLLAKVSKSIPDVFVRRVHVTADRHGVFASRLPIAPVYFTGSLYTVVASADADTTRSVSATVTEFPNAKTRIPSEDLPRAMR
jgi:hypothetical protein